MPTLLAWSLQGTATAHVLDGRVWLTGSMMLARSIMSAMSMANPKTKVPLPLELLSKG